MTGITNRTWRIFSAPIKGRYLTLLAVFMILSCYVFYARIENTFVFFPDSSLCSSPGAWSLDYEEVYFDAEDGTRLHGWFFPLETDSPVLLFCHGNAGNICHRIENIDLLLDRGIRVFIFDYRGYGRSEGEPTEAGIYQDGLAAYDFLVKHKHISPEKIIPFGRSLGACVAIEIALGRRVGSLITESAFTSTKEMAGTMSIVRFLAFLVPPHYNNLEKIAAVTVPKLIIHGENDRLVPFSMGNKLFRAAHPPKQFLAIKGADHNDTYVIGGRTYFDTLVSFIEHSKG